MTGGIVTVVTNEPITIIFLGVSKDTEVEQNGTNGIIRRGIYAASRERDEFVFGKR